MRSVSGGHGSASTGISSTSSGISVSTILVAAVLTVIPSTCRSQRRASKPPAASISSGVSSSTARNDVTSASVVPAWKRTSHRLRE